MIAIDPAAQNERDIYKLLTGSIIPRPIALVTTLSLDGVVNAAPFSYFSIVSSRPPLVSISVQRKADGMKDTARNAIATGALVIHIPDESIAGPMNDTAANLPPTESEVTRAGLTLIPSDVVPVPGLKEAKVRLECVLERSLALGEGQDGEPACDLLIARVVRFHLAEEIYDNGYILAEKLRPVSRLAGSDYARLGERFALERPSL
jgi:flavin reductase (DIM6/NTAB) family NADH-FMN oxidoreductase RutF